jgi:hypothetical protein
MNEAKDDKTKKNLDQFRKMKKRSSTDDNEMSEQDELKRRRKVRKKSERTMSFVESIEL